MIYLAAIAALSLTVACGGKPKTDGDAMMKKTPPAGATLYDRLGGEPAITAAVNEFVAIVVADNRINGFFKNADADHLKKMLVEQLCAATGGPCKYTGKDMKTAHAGMGVKEEHFNALVEDLGKALTKLGVKEDVQKDLVSALAPLKADIVTAK